MSNVIVGKRNMHISWKVISSIDKYAKYAFGFILFLVVTLFVSAFFPKVICAVIFLVSFFFCAFAAIVIPFGLGKEDDSTFTIPFRIFFFFEFAAMTVILGRLSNLAWYNTLKDIAVFLANAFHVCQ